MISIQVSDVPKGILVRRRSEGPILAGLPAAAPVRRQVIYWKPVATSAIATVIVVCLVALAVRSSKAANRPTRRPAPMTRAIPPRPACTMNHARPVQSLSELPAALATNQPRNIAHEPRFRAAPPPAPPTAPAAPPVVAAAAPQKNEYVPTGTCGTALNFIDNPVVAAHRSAAENKLLFVLHVSGDFDDPGFT